jgi:hypothetical protein
MSVERTEMKTMLTTYEKNIKRIQDIGTFRAFSAKSKVKQSHYRPGQALRDPGG